MSISAVALALYHSKATYSDRLVLIAIANFEGEHGAWPAIETIGRLSGGINRRTVQRSIDSLIALGELREERREGFTNRYYVEITCPDECDRSANHRKNKGGGVQTTPVQMPQGGVASTTKGGGVETTGGAVYRPPEPLNNLEKKPLPNLRDSEEEEFVKSFNQFWDLYPKKIDKGRAVKDFRSALKRASFESIIAGVKAYKDDPYRKPQFTKYPSSWLNADAWENFITSSEARVATEERRSKDLAYKDQFLADQRSQEALSAPAPKCQHGNTIALCRRCLS